MKYLSSIHYLERKEQLNVKTDDGKRQVEYIKQKSMEYVIENTYAEKLAKDYGISVSNSELDKYLKDLRQTSAGEISEQTNNAVILDYYGWTPDEYRYMVGKELLRQEVSYTMDKDAQKTADSVESTLINKPKSIMQTLAATISKTSGINAVSGVSGWVPKTNQDGGLAQVAAKLKKSEISTVIKSTISSGFYIIKLLDINSSQVSYEYINVPLTAFAKSLNNIEKSGKVTKFISIPNDTNIQP
jgi:parvulin-like peptidyl-prolyl isomerase